MQQGYIKSMGNGIPIEENDYHNYLDFQKDYYIETQKKEPEIVYVAGSIDTGEYLISELIEAYDYDNRNLNVIVHSIINPQNREELYQREENRIMFDIPGIYTLKVSAVDDGNRRSACEIRIPVNNRKGVL